MHLTSNVAIYKIFITLLRTDFVYEKIENLLDLLPNLSLFY